MKTLDEKTTKAMKKYFSVQKLGIESKLRSYGYTVPYGLVILKLGMTGGMPQKDLSEELWGTDSTDGATKTSQAVKAAIGHGLVEQSASETDRRAKYVSLTDSGEAAYSELCGIFKEPEESAAAAAAA